jgi:hypothetical protein
VGGEDEGLTLIGLYLDLEVVDESHCRVRYLITCDATGNLKRIYDAIIRGQRRKLESEFITNVGNILGGEVVEENPA